MKCKYFRDLIITDYIDQRLTPVRNQEVKEHLRDCSDCRRYLEAVQITGIEPFGDIKREEVPSQVWEGVKSVIYEKKKIKGLRGFKAFWEGLKGLMRPNPVLAFGSALLIVFILIMLSRDFVYDRRFSYQGVSQDIEVEYTEYIMGYNLENSRDDQGYGTYIEEVFL
jgi:anti-sigma factor RsiW